jgi:hypothetical protein
VTIKPLTTGVLASAVVGAAAASVTSVAPVSRPRVRPVCVRRAAATGSRRDVPTRRARGAGGATADVTSSGPKRAPTPRNINFVNRCHSKTSRASAMALLEEAGGGA